MNYIAPLARACRDIGLPCIWAAPCFPQPAIALTKAVTLPTSSANDADIGPKAA